MSTFAITGVGGYIAPRHIEAIKSVGGVVVAALDPHDSVGRLDQCGYYVKYFTDYERFERYLELRRTGGDPIDYLVVCSPNYLHDCHIRLGMRTCSNVICEKPVVITPHNLDAIEAHPDYEPGKVSTILQLRLSPKVEVIREQILGYDRGVIKDLTKELDVELTYITPRGEWYDHSWKGDEAKSGGLAMNIGVHLFDLMCWIFGKPIWVANHLKGPRRMSGAIKFEGAIVRWFLSVEAEDLKRAEAYNKSESKASSHRRMVVSAPTGKKRVPLKELFVADFNEGFTDMHKASYALIMDGKGFAVEDTRAAIELVHQIRTEPIGPALWHHGLRHLFK